MPIRLELKGLKELQTALARVAPGAKREFQSDLRAIGKLVQVDAQALMHFKHSTGRAKRSVRVRVVARRGFEGVQISEGGASAPHTPWLDFGGTVGRGRRTRATVIFHAGGRVTVKRHGSRGSGSVVRPYLRDGRYLYPAYFKRYDEMVAATDDAVRRAVEAAGLTVKST